MYLDFWKNEVKEYINDEIYFIEKNEDLTIQDTINDLNYLRNLKDEDIENITLSVANDDELREKIGKIIHYYLYHREDYIKIQG